MAKSYGATVLVAGLTNDQIRLDKATEVGMDYVINLQKENLKDKVNELTNGYGADVLLECSGSIHAANQGLDLLRKKRPLRANRHLPGSSGCLRYGKSHSEGNTGGWKQKSKAS